MDTYPYETPPDLYSRRWAWDGERFCLGRVTSRVPTPTMFTVTTDSGKRLTFDTADDDYAGMVLNEGAEPAFDLREGYIDEG